MMPPEQGQECGGVEQERGGADQEKAQRLADLITESQMAASLPRHRETTRELADLCARVDSIARDVRDLVNALAEHTASSRRRPNVVIIAGGDQDPASIAADLMGGGD